jgi:hypothetical protein
VLRGYTAGKYGYDLIQLCGESRAVDVNAALGAALFEQGTGIDIRKQNSRCQSLMKNSLLLRINKGFHMKTKLIIAAVLTSLISATAFAQAPAAVGTNTPKIDQREANQAARIDQGVASGALTGKEAARLENGQARVATAEANAKVDGTVTRQERKKLRHMENKQSRHIKHQKHDKQAAPAPVV